MKVIYTIFATAGWVWLIIVAAVLWKRVRKQAAGRGLEAAEKHER